LVGSPDVIKPESSGSTAVAARHGLSQAQLRSGDSSLNEGQPEPGIGVDLIGRSLSWHGLALLVVLVLIFPLVVGDTVWSADIGARLYQAKLLLTTGDWTTVHPLPEADPDGHFFPIHFSTGTEQDFQYLPLPKHPALAWLTVGLFRFGGFAAVVAIQTASTVAAAVGTARLVARTRPRLTVPTLWFTGLLSPLFFDAFVGYAHSLSAALLVWSAVLALQFAEPAEVRLRFVNLRLAAPAFLVAGACLVRTEASLAGMAMAAGLLAGGWHGANRFRWSAAAVVIGGATSLATAGDRLLQPANTGLANPGQGNDPWGGLQGRIEALQQTWFSAGRTDADLLILVAAVLILAAGLLARQRSQARVATVLLLGAVVASVLRFSLADPVLVFGLVMACPLLVVGLVRGVPDLWADAEARFCAVTSALFVGAVVATQYRFGGVAEWGGRYFAAGLPFLIVLAMPGLERALAAFPKDQARRLAVLALAAGFIVNLAGLDGLRQSRLRTQALVDEIAQSMLAVDAAGTQASRPIVITTVPAIGRLSWDHVDDGRWLLVDKDELGAVARRLAELDVKLFTLVTFESDDELADIESLYRPEAWAKTPDIPGDVIIVAASN